MRLVKTAWSAGWAALALLAALVHVLGCSTSSAPASAPNDASADAADAGGDAGDPDGEVTISGTVVKFLNPGKGLAGATIAAGSHTTVSDSNGNWALAVGTGQLFALDFTAPGYVHATDSQQSLSGNSTYNIFALVDDGTAQLLLQSFAKFDKKLGAVAVTINGESTCPDTTGATFAVTPTVPGDGGGPLILYFDAQNLPSPKATSATTGTEPSAVVYNLPVGVGITVTVKRPGCKQDPFPIVLGPGTYTGKVETTAAETSSTSLAISYLTVYLK